MQPEAVHCQVKVISCCSVPLAIWEMSKSRTSNIHCVRNDESVRLLARATRHIPADTAPNLTRTPFSLSRKKSTFLTSLPKSRSALYYPHPPLCVLALSQTPLCPNLIRSHYPKLPSTLIRDICCSIDRRLISCVGIPGSYRVGWFTARRSSLKSHPTAVLHFPSVPSALHIRYINQATDVPAHQREKATLSGFVYINVLRGSPLQQIQPRRLNREYVAEYACNSSNRRSQGFRTHCSPRFCK
ncbi:hypothetical protein L218DRAFT_953466 [Marasmius fiardii PR-910]|nr:hypothetical protein L218DRAFT_953466 [Marasmius fiardii PR-910]